MIYIMLNFKSSANFELMYSCKNFEKYNYRNEDTDSINNIVQCKILNIIRARKNSVSI